MQNKKIIIFKALKAYIIYKQPQPNLAGALLKQEVNKMFIVENPTVELLKALDIDDCDLRIFTVDGYFNIAMAEIDLKDKSVILYME